MSPDAHKQTPFLKYRTKKYNHRDRNVGKAIHNAILRKIESVLGLKKGSVTMHMFRRSRATQMADSGAGCFMLKVAGRWRSLGVAEVYVADSLARERTAMDMLSGHSVDEKELKLVSKIQTHSPLTDHCHSPFMNVRICYRYGDWCEGGKRRHRQIPIWSLQEIRKV